MWIILILQALASAFNAIMDKHQFHYGRSIFAYWAKKRTAWGDFWAAWSGPESWRNKHEGFGIAWIDLLWRTALVWLTDLWHAAQFGHFTAYQVGFALYLNEIGAVLWQGSTFLNVITWVLVLKAVHGLAFNPFFYWLLDKPQAKSNQLSIMGNEPTKTKPLFKQIAAAVTLLGGFTFISAVQMSPVIFALAFLSMVGGMAFLLYTMNKDLPDGLPINVRIPGALIIVFLFIAGLSETLTGFAIKGYEYHTVPDVGVPWIEWAVVAVFLIVVGVGVLYRKQIGAWFYE
jgi:hypothetical protein